MSTELGQPVYRITLNHALAMRLTGYALALLYVAVGMVYTAGPSGDYRIGDLRTLALAGIGALVVCTGTILVHELVHGAFFRVFGATPKYGVGRISWFGFYAYATAPGVPFTLMQMTVICLAPLLVISIAAIVAGFSAPAAAGFASLAFVTNFSGAAGDLWMVFQMWRFRNCRELRLVDTDRGLHIHTPDPAASAIAIALTAKHSGGYVHRILLRWLVTSTMLAGGVVLLAVPLSMANADRLTIGPRQFAIATYTTAPEGGFSMTLDLNAILIVGLVSAVVSLLFARRLKDPNNGQAPGSPHPALM